MQIEHAPGSVVHRPGEDAGRRFGRLSLLMLPMLIPSFIVSFAVGVWLLGMRDLEGSEPMSEQGLYGWMALTVSTLILVAPMIAGLILGAKAWRRGSRLGMVGTAVDGTILVALPTLIVIGALGQ